MTRGSSSGSAASAILNEIWSTLEGPTAPAPGVEFTGEGALPSRFAVTDFAAATIGAAGAALADLIATTGSDAPPVHVDRVLASAWFRPVVRPIGWASQGGSDLTGEYLAGDGTWVRLQMTYPRLRSATLRALDAEETRASVAARIAAARGEEIESLVVEGGGAAAVLRSAQEWAVHPQGRAVATEPLVAVSETDEGAPSSWRPLPERPLAGIRVLDLTRVLAGPMATRFLAGYGAEVLRIDPPGYDEPRGSADVTLGKRCARIDLRTGEGREELVARLSEADVIVHGYKPGVMERYGLGPEERAAIRPGLIDVSLDAYGWSGPWRERRGFDTVVEMSCGIAADGMEWADSDEPVLLPVQALDHGTGHLLAAAAVRGLVHRMSTGRGSLSRCSLARTAELLREHENPAGQETIDTTTAPVDPEIRATPGGPVRRVRVPIAVDAAPQYWDRPGELLGSSLPVWATKTREATV